MSVREPVEHTLPGPTGYAVPVDWLPAANAQGTFVMMAALGMQIRFYLPLAQALNEAGFHVAMVEQRGHGKSALRASRRVDYGFRDLLTEDIPMVLDWVDTQAPGLPVYLLGHSLGGHLAAITAGRLPERVAGLVLCACGSPWVRAFSGKVGVQLRVLCKLIPVATRLAGCYPGDRLGFGGREARTLMADWLALARTNRYSATGLQENLDAGIARYTGPVLSLRLQDDGFAPAAAMAAVTDKFHAAPVTQVVLDARTLGDRADHVRWARTPAAVVAAITDWLANIQVNQTPA